MKKNILHQWDYFQELYDKFTPQELQIIEGIYHDPEHIRYYTDYHLENYDNCLEYLYNYFGKDIPITIEEIEPQYLPPSSKQLTGHKYKGVTWNKPQRKFQAKIYSPIGKHQKHLGYFETAEEANEVYLKAVEEMRVDPMKFAYIDKGSKLNNDNYSEYWKDNYDF